MTAPHFTPHKPSWRIWTNKSLGQHFLCRLAGYILPNTLQEEYMSGHQIAVHT